MADNWEVSVVVCDLWLLYTVVHMSKTDTLKKEKKDEALPHRDVSQL